MGINVLLRLTMVNMRKVIEALLEKVLRGKVKIIV